MRLAAVCLGVILAGAVVAQITLASTTVIGTTGGSRNPVPAVFGTVSSQSGTTYTLAVGDCGTTVQFTSGSAITVTLPNSITAVCNIAIEQDGAGQITFSAASGATLHSAHSYTKTYGQYAIVGVSVLSNSGGSSAVWYLTGDGA